MATEHLLKTPLWPYGSGGKPKAEKNKVSDFTTTLSSIMTREDQMAYKKGLREGENDTQSISFVSGDLKGTDELFKKEYIYINSGTEKKHMNLGDLELEVKLEDEDPKFIERVKENNTDTTTLAFWEKKFGRIPNENSSEIKWGTGWGDPTDDRVDAGTFTATFRPAVEEKPKKVDDMTRLRKLAGVEKKRPSITPVAKEEFNKFFMLGEEKNTGERFYTEETKLIPSPSIYVTVKDESGWEDKDPQNPKRKEALGSLLEVKDAPSHKLGLYVDDEGWSGY